MIIFVDLLVKQVQLPYLQILQMMKQIQMLENHQGITTFK